MSNTKSNGENEIKKSNINPLSAVSALIMFVVLTLIFAAGGIGVYAYLKNEAGNYIKSMVRDENRFVRQLCDYYFESHEAGNYDFLYSMYSGKNDSRYSYDNNNIKINIFAYDPAGNKVRIIVGTLINRNLGGEGLAAIFGDAISSGGECAPLEFRDYETNQDYYFHMCGFETESGEYVITAVGAGKKDMFFDRIFFAIIWLLVGYVTITTGYIAYMRFLRASVKVIVSDNEKYSAIYEGVSLPIIIADAGKDRIVSANGEAEREFGVLLNKSFKNFLEKYKRGNENLIYNAKTGRHFNFECNPIENPEGCNLFMFVNITDEIKLKAENEKKSLLVETLVATGKRLVNEANFNSALINSFKTMYCILDADYKILSANPLFIKTLGYPEEDILQRDISIFAEGLQSENIALIKSDGGRINAGLNIFEIKDGDNPDAAFCAQFLAPEKKAAAPGTPDTGKFLELIFDNVPYSIFWKTPESIYMGCNRAYRELVGIENMNLIGKSEYDFNIPEIAEMFIKEDRKLIESRKNIYHRERSFVRNGKELSVATSKVLILNEKDEPFVILGIIEDITETAKIRRQLVGAMEKAEDASRAKSDFLSRMSHELRTPMNAIIGMTKIALNTDNPQKMKNSLEKIDAASKQLLGIINDILDMSKIEARKFEINSEAFDFGAMIEKIYNIILVKAEEKNIKFTLNIDGGIEGGYIGDEIRLTQVIINLLGNAVKFTPENGLITLTANARPDPSDINCEILEFRVSDTGIGISKEQQDKLFNLFEQADGTISRKYGGTGLGLAISKNIVELMGGGIHIESEPGKGSSFIFTVKLKKNGAPYAKPRDKDRDEISDFSAYHIIVAEDVEINREIVASILEDTRINIDFAENGEEAYKLFLENQDKYDLILMDIQMPVLNGYEATKMIRELGKGKAAKIPIIAMTASAFQEDVNESKKVGMNGHIAKPIDISLLMGKLREFLLYNKNNPGISGHAEIKTEPEKSKQPVTAEMLLPDIILNDGLEKINGNKKLFVSLMKNFKGRELLEKLVAALDKNKIKESISIASNLRGLGLNLGMPLIYSNALLIENCLKSSGCLIEPDYMSRLKESLDGVTGKINMIIENELE